MDEVTLKSSKTHLLKELRTTTNHTNIAQAYKILAESEAVESRTAIEERNAEQQMEANKRNLALQFRKMERELDETSPLKV